MAQRLGTRVSPGYDLLLVASTVTILQLIATWPLALRLTAALPGDLGDPLLVSTILAWDASRLLHGLAGLWDAPFFHPYPNTLAYSEHLVGVAVLTAPLQWITGNPLLVYNVAFIGAPVLAAVGGFGLTRELWGRRDAAWIGALALAFAPYRADHGTHLQMLVSGWMPIALWALHRYFAGGSWRALSAFVVAFCLQGLSNGYFLVFFSIAIVLVGSVELATVVWRTHREPVASVRVAPLAGQLLAAAILVGLVFLPVIQAYSDAQRDAGLVRSVEEATALRARPGDYLHAPQSLRLWGNVIGSSAPERALFPGLVIVLLSVVGVVVAVARRAPWGADARDVRRHVLTYVALAFLAYTLSQGPRSDIYAGLLQVVPGFDGLRVPARFVVLVSLALAVLAAGGAAWLFQRLGRSQAATVLAVGLGLVIVAEGFAASPPLATFRPAQRQRAALHSWLAAQPEGALLELPISASDLEFTPAYQYATLLHGRRIVNGYSGWGTPLQDFLAGPTTGASPLSRLDQLDGWLEGLSRIGVRFVILHRSTYSRVSRDTYTDPQPLIDAMNRSVWTEEGQAFPPIQAWRLKQIPGDSIAVNPSGTSLAAGRDFHVSGGDTLTVTLARPVDVAAVELAVPDAARGRYPSRVRIASPDTAGQWRVLVDRLLMPDMVEALVRTPRSPTVVVRVPANASAVLQVEHTNGDDQRPWQPAVTGLVAR